MCGITGVWHSDDAGTRHDLPRMAAAMVATLHHRGPDDRGVWVDPQAGLALGHTRLAIVDLSPAGAQPMASADGRLVIVFNGEIYNAHELRAELELLGCRFRGHSDTEVLVEGLAAWGVEACLRRLVGMFAFALWDRTRQLLTLARDRLGKKPLYWGRVNGLFLFGSELKALRAHPGWQPEIDQAALAAYLRWRCIPAPHSIYRHIRKLPPGHLLELTAGGEPEPRPYWVPQPGAGPLELRDAEAVEQLDALLRDAVGRRMVADVPLGAFLSGGIDSSLVTALMQEQSGRAVQTYSIGFAAAGFDEAPHARAVAAHLGTAHTELYVQPADALGLVGRLPLIFDEPFADASQIPTCLLATLTRRHVTVALSGDGGDELFAGYRRYGEAEQVWRQLSRVPGPVRRLAGQGLASLQQTAIGRLIAGAPVMAAPERLEYWAAILAAADGEAFYQVRGEQWRRPEAILRAGGDRAAGQAASGGKGDLLARMQLADLQDYLPNDVLVKVDRATMAAALEVRSPLLDHRVVEMALRLPRPMKVREGRTKWLLRQVLARYVPDPLVDRPKAGFSVPLAAWLRGPLRDWAQALLDPGRLRREGIFTPAPIAERWRQHLAGTRDWHAHVWTVLMFQAWLEQNRVAAAAMEQHVPVQAVAVAGGLRYALSGAARG